MKKTWVGTVVALAAVLSNGCGTVANLATGRPEIYGGVAKDLDFAQKPHSVTPATGKGGVALLCLYVADLSLSLVGDTLTLPFILCKQGRIAGSSDSTVSAPCGDPGRQSQYSAGGISSPGS
jgi:uncharacterized protein YceK